MTDQRREEGNAVDRPRLYRRVCAACLRLDRARGMIAGTPGEAHRQLAAEDWSCPDCGAQEALVTTRLEDEDLEGLSPPVVRIRRVRAWRDGRPLDGEDDCPWQ
jgi:rubredoxin